MPHSFRTVALLLLVAAGAGPWHGWAEDAAPVEDAPVPHAEVREAADAPAAPPKPPGEELAAAPYVYPLLRMRVAPEMR